jgi:hypothetical protein
MSSSAGDVLPWSKQRRMRDSNPRGREPNSLSKSALDRSVKVQTTPRRRRLRAWQPIMNPAKRSRGGALPASLLLTTRYAVGILLLAAQGTRASR